MKPLFLIPHNDDEALFCAFSIMRNPGARVIILYDSFIQPSRGHKHATASVRRHESMRALSLIGVVPEFAGLRDDQSGTSDLGITLIALGQAEQVYAPAFEEGGNEHHNMVEKAASGCWPGKVKHYMTYTEAGKSISDNRVIPTPVDLRLKLQMLACYRSQHAVPDCLPHFLRSQEEYLQ